MSGGVLGKMARKSLTEKLSRDIRVGSGPCVYLGKEFRTEKKTNGKLSGGSSPTVLKE